MSSSSAPTASATGKATGIPFPLTDEVKCLDWLKTVDAFLDVPNNTDAKRLFKRWIKAAEGLQTVPSLITYVALKKSPSHLTPTDEMRANLQRVSSNERHLQILDKHGNILAYRLRVPVDLVQNLEQSAAELPPMKAESQVRGNFVARHYACWSGYEEKNRPLLSSEYLNQLPRSQAFLDRNEKLFKLLANNLRFLAPKMYAKYVRIQKDLPQGCRALAQAWLGVAINQGQDDVVGTGTHKDVNDVVYGYNCVVPYGSYKGADLILWQLGVQLELVPGDALFFLGAKISHNTTGVEEGLRNSIDLFSHYKPFLWRKTLLEGGTSKQMTEKDIKRAQKAQKKQAG